MLRTAAAFMAMGILLTTLPLCAQNYLYNQAAFPTGNGPSAVIVADFNSDGKPDIAVSNFNDNTVSILLGLRNGTFAAPVSYATGKSPAALVAADFNGDKKLDLAVINENGNTVSILINNGDGTFQTHVDYPTGTTPVGIVAGQFNGDNKMDLAIANENDSTVSILLGNGDGSFQSASPVTVDATPTALASGDFNHDGKLDLITANAAGTVTVLLSAGNGTFTRVDSSAGGNASAVAVGDFNKDGKLDAVVESQATQQIYLLLGNGNGSFQPPAAIPNVTVGSTSALLAADLNGDGKMDLALGGIVVLLGNGDGTFQTPLQSPLGGYTSWLAAGDFNGDRRLDLVMTDPNLNGVDVLLGNGRGRFGAMTKVNVGYSAYGPDWLATADFNGDGKPDLALAEINFPSGKVSVELGKGNGTFGPPIISALATSAVNANLMLPGDFNGDGKMDLLVMDSYRTGFEVLTGKGDGSFESPVDTTLSYSISYLTVGDFDGDGKADLAITSSLSGGVTALHIYLSNGDGTFRLAHQYTAGFGGQLITADVNQDRKLDLVVGTSSGLQIFLGNGDGSFQAPLSGPSGSFSGLAAGDFNHDGNVDLVAGTLFGMAFMAGNGNGTFQAPVISNPSFSFANLMLTGDFNHDGKLDLLVSPPGNTTLSGPVILLGNGNGTFRAPVTFGASGVMPNGFDTADLNLDRSTDFALPSIATSGSNGTALSAYVSVPTPNLFPNTLKFGKQAVGTTSSSQTAILTNLGNSPLSISSVNISGDFHLTYSCSGKLAIGGKCYLVVTFTPTQTGTRTGTVIINDNALASPQTIHLAGTGT